ncbi:hypothetical protein I5907_20845 [Panacibacter sp. DH6]|uniref:Tetratricopeptide repeat protein n=1 Tax=Panacibacter microcysteis TaxID=2793269 RepID=A0A931H0C5_9BACT|nr:tetratricopeptide repeat protein [Panacibacter microcysteis]MBG9378692.1 hypothetical protein [Panacibacter microcysteis]
MNRIEKLQAYLEKSPDDNFLKHALALEFRKMNDDAMARKLFEDILTKDPSYVGSYYQLGKLLEELGEKENAVAWYEKGMTAARTAKDNHAYNELRSAYEELID